MEDHPHPRSARAARRFAGSAAFAFGLAGCQSYQPAPLDLGSYRAAIDARLVETEPVAQFAARLAEAEAAPASFDPADGLSASEGEALAIFYNPDLRRARAAAGVALARLEHAGLWRDPEFGFDGAEILSPAGVFEYGLTLGLTLPVSGRLAVEKALAGAEHEAELRRVADAEWSKRADVRRGWSAWSIATEQAALLREVVSQVERVDEITRRLEEAGELTRPEARLLRIELAERRSLLAGAELEAAQARLRLLGMIGLAPDAAVKLVPSLTIPRAAEVADPVARLIESSTELAIERAEYRAAEEAFRLEIREQYPDVALGFGYGSEDGDDRLLLGLSVEVPLWNANRAGIAEARAARELARIGAEAAFERLAGELASAQASLASARAQRERYETEIVPMLAEQASEVERIAELGEVDTLLLLETVTRQHQAKARLLDLRRAELEAQIEIARLLGPKGDPR